MNIKKFLTGYVCFCFILVRYLYFHLCCYSDNKEYYTLKGGLNLILEEERREREESTTLTINLLSIVLRVCLCQNPKTVVTRSPNSTLSVRPQCRNEEEITSLFYLKGHSFGSDQIYF